MRPHSTPNRSPMPPTRQSGSRSPSRSALANHDAAVAAAASQAGAVSRQQLLSLGWTRAQVRSQLAAQRWSPLMRGVYLTYTGSPSAETWWWAAHLFAGPNSALTGLTALQAWRVLAPEMPVHIEVSHADRILSPDPGSLIVTRRRTPRPTREPRHLPPAVRPAHAVLDVCAELINTRKIDDLITKVVRTRTANPASIQRALDQRGRINHRGYISALLRDVASGADSVLEVDGVRLVLRAHGLPVGQGQVREYVSGALVIRDRVIKEYRTVIEFDGRRGHDDPGSRLRDYQRDNYVALTGRTPIRLGWADVHHDACESASIIARVLRMNGWSGTPTTCGAACIVTS